MRPILLPCIFGPTGAGKTAAALALADVLPVSVINADSRQVYRDFPLITAQPTAEERAVCPHLLYGYLPSEKKLGAGEWARAAAAAVEREHAGGRVPLLVGGTGLYARALLAGIAPIPEIPAEVSARWQTRLAAEGCPALHAELAAVDPAYAAKIHPNDRQRVARALEVAEATGKPLSWWHARPLPRRKHLALKAGVALPLAELEPLLLRRIDAMLAAGALEEARAAMVRCPDPAAPGWSGIGCAELHRHLSGGLTLEECRALWLKNTRAYAKRQLTWFRADGEMTWFRPEEAGRLRDFLLRGLERMNIENVRPI